MHATARLTNKPLQQSHKSNDSKFTLTEIQQIEKMAISRTFEKKQYIYYPQEPSKAVYYLKEGRVKIGTYSNDGKEVIKSIIYPGQLFGELGLIGEEQRSDFAKSLNEPIRVVVININDMRVLMNEDMRLNLKVMTQIGNRLRKVERRLESLIFKSARARIVDLLKDMAIERGLKVGYEVLLRHFFSHREIAAMTGTSRQTVTKVLSELKRSNLIHTDRKNILIRDLTKLE